MSTLALNIIVGPGESEVLERAIQSVLPIGFDEIVVCLTSKDQEVANTAAKYATKIAYYEWDDDFATARNACIDATESDYIFWMDADDILSESCKDKAAGFGQTIKSGDLPFYFITYNLEFNDKGNVDRATQRISVFKRGAGEWKYPVHEGLVFPGNGNHYGVIEDISLDHRPVKKESSCPRNLKIMESYLNENPGEPRMSFYYAKELLVFGKVDKAIYLMNLLVERADVSTEERAYCCRCISFYYAYKIKDEKQAIRPDTVHIAETYARVGLSLCDNFAELYVVLGDIAEYRGQNDAAIRYFKRAMECTLTATVEQDRRYYTFIPADRISILSYKMNNPIEALRYNDTAYKAYDDNRIIQNRKTILESMLEGCIA